MFTKLKLRSVASPMLLTFCILLAFAPASARELSTDRPDQTESPYSVENRRLQAEFQIASVGRDGGASRWAWQVGGLNMKRGLSNRADLQLVFPCVESVPAGAERETGIGDLTVRLKWNLRGNDCPGIAVGVMPTVTLPTGAKGFTAGGWEAGLILPVAMPVPGGAGLGLMAQGDIVRDGDGDGVHPEGFFTATVGRDLAGPLAGFVEIATRLRPRAEGSNPLALDVGMTYGMSEDAQLDAGVQWGLGGDAEDQRFFVGYTIRR